MSWDSSSRSVSSFEINHSDRYDDCRDGVGQEVCMIVGDKDRRACITAFSKVWKVHILQQVFNLQVFVPYFICLFDFTVIVSFILFYFILFFFFLALIFPFKSLPSPASPEIFPNVMFWLSQWSESMSVISAVCLGRGEEGHWAGVVLSELHAALLPHLCRWLTAVCWVFDVLLPTLNTGLIACSKCVYQPRLQSPLWAFPHDFWQQTTHLLLYWKQAPSRRLHSRLDKIHHRARDGTEISPVTWFHYPLDLSN